MTWRPLSNERTTLRLTPPALLNDRPFCPPPQVPSPAPGCERDAEQGDTNASSAARTCSFEHSWRAHVYGLRRCSHPSPWSTTPSATHPAILLMLLFAASQQDPEPEAPPDCLLIPCPEPEAPPDCLLIPGPEPEAPPDCLLVEFLATLASAAYRSHVCIPHTLKPTSACPLRSSCTHLLAMYASSWPRWEYVRRPTFRSMTHGLEYPAVTSSRRRNEAVSPAAAAARVAAAVGSSPAAAAIPAASTSNLPRYTGMYGANPASDAAGSRPAATAPATRR
mmetsp:Transcript_10803/g.26418  ORF Transcript_10803/g.26418 Transcript_10803/m.26418 type:complete len:279 (-) Transcript_10803:228-1064(-)